MSTFAHYLFRQAGSALILILLSLIGVVWIALALKQLKLVTSKGQDVVTLVSMTSLAIPNLLAVIAPIALLIAVIHVLNRLNGDSELIVVTASGGAIWTIAKPLLAVALIVAASVAFVNHVGMPWSLRLLREKITQVRTDLISQVLLPGRFSSPEPGVVVHIRSRGLDGMLYGLLISDRRSGKARLDYLAERGEIVKQNDETYLVMHDGHIIRETPAFFDPQEVLAFKSYAIDLERFEHRYSHVWKPRERYWNDLLAVDETAKRAGYRIGHFKAELHERLSNPLYPILFVLIAVAFVGQAQSTRQNRTQMIAAAFVVAALFRGGGLALNNVVVLNPSMVPLMYALPLGGIIFSTILIRRNEWPKAGLSISDRIEMAVGGVWGLIRRRSGRAPALQAGE